MRISDKKKEKICEQILFYLYSINPQPVFTIQIANEIARDEEFTKGLLISLKKKGLVLEIKKNPAGVDYLKRARWKLSNKTYYSYKNLIN
jgi:predicted transcriptional regulator with HTH domain